MRRDEIYVMKCLVVIFLFNTATGSLLPGMQTDDVSILSVVNAILHVL